MVSLHSLGVNTPSALQWLIAENILPENPAPHLYTWKTYATEDPRGRGEIEEVLATERCVVWSRGGLIRKAFNFSIEQQKVSQALLTWFPTEAESLGPPSFPAQTNPLRTQGSAEIYQAEKRGDIGRRGRTRALVVLLKLQAHIYYWSGPTYTFSLPFEVDSAFSTPEGLLLQRRKSSTLQPTTPRLPSAPANSFASPTMSRSFPTTHQAERHGSTSPALQVMPYLNLGDLVDTGGTPTDAMPRHFLCTDPLSEFGLLTLEKQSDTSNSVQNSKARTVTDILPETEDLVYLSSETELEADNEVYKHPLLLAATFHAERSVITLWQGIFIDSEAVLPKVSSEKLTQTAGRKPRRRSSFIATGLNTPSRGQEDRPRNSLVGLNRSEQMSASAKSNLKAVERSSAEEALVSSLDPDFETLGPGREARRVSSLLSRTEFSTSFDRFAYQELNATQVGPQSRRGRSLNPHSDRVSASFVGRTSLRTSLVGNLGLSAADLHPVLGLSISSMSAMDQMQPTDRSYDLPIDPSHPPAPESIDHNPPKRDLCLRKVGELQMQFCRDAHLKPTDDGSEKAHRFKIFTTRTSTGEPLEGLRDGELYVNIVDRRANSFHNARLCVENPRRSMTQPAISTGACDDFLRKWGQLLILEKVAKHNQCIDADRIHSAGAQRVVIIKRGANSATECQLLSPCTDTVLMPLRFHRLRIFNDYIPQNTTFNRLRTEIGVRRTLVPGQLQAIDHVGLDGVFDLMDAAGIFHKVQLRLETHLQPVDEVLNLCDLLLPQWLNGAIFSLWMNRNEHYGASPDAPWNAIMFAFGLINHLIHSRQGLVGKSQQQKHTSSNAARLTGRRTNTESEPASASMWSLERHSALNGVVIPSAWSWTTDRPSSKLQPEDSTSPGHRACRSFLCNGCRTKEYLQFTPTDDIRLHLDSIFSQRGTTKEYFNHISRALKLLREEHHLDATSEYSLFMNEDLSALITTLDQTPFDAPAGTSSHAHAKSPVISVRNQDKLPAPSGKIETSQRALDRTRHFSTLSWTLEQLATNFAGAGSQHNEVLCAITGDNRFENSPSEMRKLQAIFPRITVLNNLFTLYAKDKLTSSGIIEALPRFGVDSNMLQTFSNVVFSMLQESLVACRRKPSTKWGSDLLKLVSRSDLTWTPKAIRRDGDPAISQLSHPIRDFHNIGHSADSPDSAIPYPEGDKIAVSRLIFSRDRRYIEALRMIEPIRVAVAVCSPDPSWDEAQLLEAQKEVVQHVMTRTFSLAPGLGMAHYNSRKPLLTEKYVIHGYSTMCIMKPLNNTVMADRSAFTEERFGWAWFHAGVAAGLAISKNAIGIDTSWIVFNKPPEPNNRHAGLLLALGLNGHLKSIARWLAFKYLSPKHTMTTVGLLLGMSASYLGTMDALVTRLLSVHITRMLPPGAAELNLSPLAQTTGLMGIGLLYCGTQHRRMSEIMLSEIESLDTEDQSGGQDVLRDESYRLAAGFALGLINLGFGKDLGGLRDLHLVERLLSSAAGPKPVNLVHVMEQASAGATIAIALIFMKTQNETVARKIDVPDTVPQFAFVRPDILLLRTLAKNLILWDSITADSSWLIANLPKQYRKQHKLETVTTLGSDQLPFFSILTGLLWSVSLKNAGTCDIKVRDFLLQYLDQFIRLCRLPAVRYDAKLTRNAVRNCQDLLSLAAATVMAGTGDLEVMRRLRRLHGRVNAETPYGSHLATHMALGALFIGGGTFTFGTSNLAIASLICAFYPLFPADVTDNKAHLQAFRHFWVLAAEPRCVIARDIDSQKPCHMPLKLKLLSGRQMEVLAPCILPDFRTIAQISTNDNGFWPVTIDLVGNAKHAENFAANQTICVRRRPHREAYQSTFIHSLASAKATSSPSVDTTWLSSLNCLAVVDASDWSDWSDENDGSGVHSGGFSLDSSTAVRDEHMDLWMSGNTLNKQSLASIHVVLKWVRYCREHGKGKLHWLNGDFTDLMDAALDARLRS